MGFRKRTNAKSDKITEEIPESIPENVPEVVPDIPMPEVSTSDIDAEFQRKQEIADKRRASLALARSKIIPKSTLKKQVQDATKATEELIKGKDEVIKIKQEETDAMRLKYERDRVKQLEDSLITLQKLIGDKAAAPAAPVPEPVKEKYKRPSRAKSAIVERGQTPLKSRPTTRAEEKQPQQIIPKKSIEPRLIAPSSTEKLIDLSYGEQLQERLRTQALHRIMNDTFGGF